ncbi:MAG: hypothetical protein FJ014_18165 [Chloroflexi bacterium]|nr:hypothetical protein [Chloroflexota bacterium]
MLVKRFLNMLCITIVSLLGATACTPDMQSEAGAVVPPSATATASNQVQSHGEGVVVDVTPMSDTELAVQSPGQSEPGAGAASGESQAEPEAQGGQPQPGTMVVYADSTFKFSVGYPADFVFHTQPAEKLAQFDPMPAASFIFMNPVTASSDVADLEPADLEIRVYVAGQIASLDSWLTSNGLLPADGTVPLKPFQTANVSGVQVCASTMIAPGCSYFILGNGLVYQLTPATLEGETMVRSFMLIQ